MSLARAELRRLFKRRFTRWMLVFVVLVLGTIVAGIAATNQAHGPEVRAQAEAQAQEQFQQQMRGMQREIAECERAQAAGEDVAHWPPDCEEIRQWYMTAGPDEMVDIFMPPTFNFRGQYENLLVVFSVVLGLFAFIVGASFVGAEWRSGGMMNLLLWRPRRSQVFAAKLGTLLAALSGVVLLLGTAWTGAFWLVAIFRGVTDTMTFDAWQSFGLTGLRGLVLVLAAGAVGFAIASLGRHTATALGAAIVAFVVGVVGVSAVVFAAGAPFPQAWLWTSYVDAWMRKSVTFRDFSTCEPVGQFGMCEPATMEVTWQTAGTGIGVVVVGLLGAAMWHMRRRDVT